MIVYDYFRVCAFKLFLILLVLPSLFFLQRDSMCDTYPDNRVMNDLDQIRVTTRRSRIIVAIAALHLEVYGRDAIHHSIDFDPSPLSQYMNRKFGPAVIGGSDRRPSTPGYRSAEEEDYESDSDAGEDVSRSDLNLNRDTYRHRIKRPRFTPGAAVSGDAAAAGRGESVMPGSASSMVMSGTTANRLRSVLGSAMSSFGRRD
jgi:hypothetical protein